MAEVPWNLVLDDIGKRSEALKRKKTNADIIRAMTDEELDKFLGEVQWDVANYCGSVTQKQEYPVPEQRGAWLDWLRQEVKDGAQENSSGIAGEVP